MKRLRGVRNALDKHAELFVTLIASILSIVTLTIWIFSPADLGDIRDFGLIIAAILAFPLGFWRSRVAERQASAAQEQVRATQQQLRTSQLQTDAAQAQVEIARQSLLNERYQRGAEMLGSKVLAVRLGGIYALQRLAKEQPEEYHVEIMRLLCAFIRNPTVDGKREIGLTDHKTGETTETDDSGHACPRQDVEAAMEAIATRSKIGIDLERDNDFRLDLRNAHIGALRLLRLRNVALSGAQLTDANLSGIWLSKGTDLSSIREGYGVNLSKARLSGVNFSSSNLWAANLSDSLLVRAELQIADLRHADLSRATLANADLSGEFLRDSILTGTKFSIAEHPPAMGLTQEELDKARADPKTPPRLDGVLDAFTGEQLVWRGKPLADET